MLTEQVRRSQTQGSSKSRQTATLLLVYWLRFAKVGGAVVTKPVATSVDASGVENSKHEGVHILAMNSQHLYSASLHDS